MATKPTAPEESKEVARIVDAAGGVVERQGDVISKYVKRDMSDVDVVAEAVHLSIIQDIMASADVDSVLFVPDPEKLEEFVGRRVRLDAYTVQESEFEQGPPIYLTLKFFDEDSKTKHIVNTGEQAVMAQVVRLDQLKALPHVLTVKKSNKPNKYGRYPLRLTGWEAING